MFYKDKSQKYGIRSCCKKCDDKTTELWRKNNKDVYLANQRERSRGKHAKKVRKIRSQKHRTEMSNMYIRSLITKKSKILKSEDISDEFIIIYRENLKLKRFLRKQKQPT
jgi:hypothetical protein